jgi:hypothetical protein
MRRTALKETEALPAGNQETPANYLSPAVIESITSVKGQNKEIFDKLVARTLIDIIKNGKDNKEKLAAIDRYQKLTQSSQILVKNGSSTAAFETNNESSTTLNIDLSSHVKSDEHIEVEEVKSRDLVAEKHSKMFGEIEDAEYEIIED